MTVISNAIIMMINIIFGLHVVLPADVLWVEMSFILTWISHTQVRKASQLLI